MKTPIYIRRVVRKRAKVLSEGAPGMTVRHAKRTLALEIGRTETPGETRTVVRVSDHREEVLATVPLGDTSDFLPVDFLEKGRAAAHGVGRVLISGTPDGTCFMISDELLITCHHVIPSVEAAAKASVQFNFEADPSKAVRFSLDTDRKNRGFFMENEKLDYVVIARGERFPGEPELGNRGTCPLPRPNREPIIKDFVNIIQHRLGRAKEIVIRENRVTRPGLQDTMLHYQADTDAKSSGSPVFNDNWQVVALHRRGETTGHVNNGNGGSIPVGFNEGTRAKVIVEDLMNRRAELSGPEQAMLARALGI